MLRSFLLVSLCSAGAMGLASGIAQGQDFPSKPIRVVTTGAGGGSDVATRLIAPGISSSLGQPVVVDNRANGVIAGEIVLRAAPDGHTLNMAGGGLWLTPLLRKTSFDPVNDFVPIALVVREASVAAVHPSLPVKSIKELIALAKARPGSLNYASSTAGTTGHLATELFKAMAGVNIVWVAYKGSGQSLSALISGEVQLVVFDVGLVLPHIKAGKMRALAVTSATPSALTPGLPTVAAAGVPGYEAVSVTALFAPAKTPTAIVNRLNQEVVRVLNQADIKERFLSTGAETVGGPPEDLAAYVKTDMARKGKLIRDLGIKGE